MTVKYKTVITKAGAEKLAAATVPNGKKVNFTAMAVGDGGGTLPVPDAGQTKLVNEVWRHALNKISQDNKHQNYVIAELLIPPETGGFWMREMGLYDDTGTLIAVGNMAESYKPLLAEGSGRAQTVRMVIMVSDIESVELTIDTSTVMATQDYVDDKLAEHEQSRLHPDATLKEKGFTQLSSATDSTSETLAATPKAVKAVSDEVKTLENSLGDAAFRDVVGKSTAELIPVGYKGIFISDTYHGPIDFATYEFVAGESLFIDTRYSFNNPPFLNQDYYFITVINATGPAQGGRVNRPLIQFVSYSSPAAIYAIREDDGTTISWRYFQTLKFDEGTQNVTIPGDVRALNGGIQLSQNTISIRGTGNKHLWFYDPNGKEMGLVYATDDKVLHLRAGEGPTININSNGTLEVPGPVGSEGYYKVEPSGAYGWYGAGSFAGQYSNSAPFLIPLRYSTPKNISVYLPLIKGLSQTDYHGYGSAVSFGILRSGVGDFGSAIIQVIGDNGSGAILAFNANGRLDVPSQVYSGGRVDAAGDITSAANIYSSGQLNSGGNIVAGQGVYESGGQVRVYSLNNPPPNQSGSTNTGNYSAYYRHGNGQIFMQCIGGVYSNSRTNPDVTVYLPASFPNGILAISGSYSGNGGIDSDSWWSASAISANAFNLHTRNTDGTFSFVVTGY